MKWSPDDVYNYECQTGSILQKRALEKNLNFSHVTGGNLTFFKGIFFAEFEKIGYQA